MSSQVLTRGFCQSASLVAVRGFSAVATPDTLVDGYWDEKLRKKMKKRRAVETEDEAAIMYLIDDFLRRQPWR